MPFDLFLGVALFDGFAFIVCFFAFSEADLEFGVAVLVEENTEGNDGVPFFFDLILQFS